MTAVDVGQRVVLPCARCGSTDCLHARETGTVLRVGRVLVDVLLDNPPRMWRERRLSDRTKYSATRLRAL